MKLFFSAVGKLQTAIKCPTCQRTGKETMFTGCCSEYMLGLLGIHSTPRRLDYDAETFLRGEDGCCHAYDAETFLRGEDGCCYAYDDDNQES